jgi:hypothetical protein
MTTPRVSVQDYVPGEDAIIQDPTDTHEHVSKEAMDELAKLLTLCEELAQMGEAYVDFDIFYEKRGAFLDRLQSGDVWKWLNEMRMYGRCPFPRYEVVDDAEEETGQREGAPYPAA